MTRRQLADRGVYNRFEWARGMGFGILFADKDIYPLEGCSCLETIVAL